MRLVALLAALLSGAPAARAGISDSMGVGPRALALGGSYAARPGDAAATWYNPAGLAPPGDSGAGALELSLAGAWARPLVHSDTPDGAPLPLATDPPDVAGLLLGLRVVPERRARPIAVGLAVYLPRHVFSWAIHPDDAPQWLLLTERAQYVSLQAGAAWRPLPWLAVGAGFDAVFDVETRTSAQVVGFGQSTDEATGEERLDVRTTMGEDLDLTVRLAPLAGLLLSAGESLAVGLSWRGENGGEDFGRTTIVGVPGLGDLGYPHHFVHFWRPHELTAAACWLPGPGLALSLDLTWARWSAGRTINDAALGPGRFGDTLVTAAGVSWRATGGLELLAGYRFEPAPFSNHGGPTNLLVADRHTGSAGVSLDLARLAGPAAPPLSVLAAAQLQWLPETAEDKDWRRFATDARLQANPGYPGYRYGGAVPGVMIALETAW